MITKRLIEVKFQKEGIHKYPAALTDPKLKDVEFLGYPHRHIFHFKVLLEVFHNDRDVEFILFKRELEALYGSNTLNIDFMSCEMLAEELIGYISEKYPNRDMVVKVYEDNENGAILQYTAPVRFEENMK
jgi:hypothetical protein